MISERYSVNSFLNNLSVRMRLLGFIILLLTLLVAAGAGGLWGMRDINSYLSSVYTKDVIPLEMLRSLDHQFQINYLGVVDKIIYEQISWDEAMQATVDNYADLSRRWQELQKITDTGYSQVNQNNWLLPFQSIMSKVDTINKELIKILEQKNIDRLDDLQDKKLPSLAQEYDQAINILIQDRIISTKDKYDTAGHRYAVSRIACISTILVGLIAGLFLGYLLIQSVDKPLGQIKDAIKQMTKGDLTCKVDYDSKDEFKMVIDGFNQMNQFLSDLVSQINLSGIQVTSSITELAATAKEQEATANEHAATTSEIAASTTEIAATASNLLSTMKKVNSLTKNSAFAASEGHAGLTKIDKTMVRMDEATTSIVSKLSVLNEKASNIAGVVKTINKVADQTNLLSLNAAIEAEKAGEYGAGFAVVATEIRRLADQTAVSTFDIELMVKDVQSAVSSAVMAIDKFAEDVRKSVTDIRDSGEQLTGVIEQVQVLIPQVSVVNDGIEAQSLGAKQISDATSQLNEAAQQTAESISQTGKTIAQLQDAARGLQEAIARFKIS